MLTSNKHRVLRAALPCTLPPVWLELPDLLLIRKLSYSPSSKPSRTVLFLDVMYTTDPHHRSKSYSPPCAAPFNLFLHGQDRQSEGRTANKRQGQPIRRQDSQSDWQDSQSEDRATYQQGRTANQRAGHPISEQDSLSKGQDSQTEGQDSQSEGRPTKICQVIVRGGIRRNKKKVGYWSMILRASS